MSNAEALNPKSGKVRMPVDALQAHGMSLPGVPPHTVPASLIARAKACVEPAGTPSPSGVPSGCQTHAWIAPLATLLNPAICPAVLMSRQPAEMPPSLGSIW